MPLTTVNEDPKNGSFRVLTVVKTLTPIKSIAVSVDGRQRKTILPLSGDKNYSHSAGWLTLLIPVLSLEIRMILTIEDKDISRKKEAHPDKGSIQNSVNLFIEIVFGNIAIDF
jgi:hypothetical protein